MNRALYCCVSARKASGAWTKVIDLRPPSPIFFSPGAAECLTNLCMLWFSHAERSRRLRVTDLPCHLLWPDSVIRKRALATQRESSVGYMRGQHITSQVEAQQILRRGSGAVSICRGAACCAPSWAGQALPLHD